jgi:NAD(P)-dependent dehydrogenase (short-subunit alcohol dehydrogenase family)
MNRKHDPQVVVITGASGGIGRATVAEFARHGAKIAMLAHGEDGLNGAVREALHDGAAQALAIPTDVADFDQVEASPIRFAAN